MFSPETGYTGQLLRVDLTTGTISVERLEDSTFRKYIGGLGLGLKILYDEVPPGTAWSSPENRLVLASGVLGGTRVPGSGTFSVATKGPLTNGAATSQANGFLGAFLKFCGFTAIVLQGAAKEWQYLYIYDGGAELKDARHLAGKDTWEIEDSIKSEMGQSEHQTSVFGIGPAGENLVKYATIVGDRGHVAAHNGVGAVMGSKKLKAIAVARGKGQVAVKDSERLTTLVTALRERTSNDPILSANRNKWGTLYLYPFCNRLGMLPIKNYTTSIYPDKSKLETFAGPYLRSHTEPKPHPCWGCQLQHCHISKITEGPFAGRIVEEPEYEGLAAFGSNIGQTDVMSAMAVSSEVDRLGMDCNETGWVLSFLMEAYEKGVITDKDTDGLKMNWANTDAVRTIINKIAHRQGVGDLLAEGVKKVAEHFGGEALNMAIYTKKGSTPRHHDHRANWLELFDTCISNTGSMETNWVLGAPELTDLGLPLQVDQFSWEQVATRMAQLKGTAAFEDCVVTCRFCTLTAIKTLAEMIKAVTGWPFTMAEAIDVGLRAVNLSRAFNVRHGITSELDAPSRRYSSMPIDGPAAGKCIAPVWEQMVRRYYQLMGWDDKTSRPLPATLKGLGLDYVIPDLWSA